MSAFIIISMLLAIITVLFFAISYKSNQHTFIETYKMPKNIALSLRKHYPQLSAEQCELAIEALKEYFLICNLANGQLVAMPSKVVDVAWHAFILNTKEYKSFCRKAFGRFLHHTPSSASVISEQMNTSLKRTWQITCRRNYIDANNPDKLPLLFSIDDMLNIKEGFKYTLAKCSEKGVVSVSLFSDEKSSTLSEHKTTHSLGCGGYASR